jgi:hypothetical protein
MDGYTPSGVLNATETLVSDFIAAERVISKVYLTSKRGILSVFGVQNAQNPLYGVYFVMLVRIYPPKWTYVVLVMY